jgi:uncharacterized protein YbjT (DUF2867 family)
MKTFTILGATGNTGSAAAHALLNAGQTVRVVGRDAKKLEACTAKGAAAFVGDQSDTALLTRAFTGADGVYVLIPPHMTTADYHAYADQLTGAFVEAIRSSGVKNVVFLSSLGAEHAGGTGPIAGLHRAEQTLKALNGVNTLAIRAGYFHANLFGSLGMIKHMGINGGVMRGDVPVAMIAPSDIGNYAAKAFLNGLPSGFTTVDLAYHQTYTMNEVTAKLGLAIGKPELPYVVFSDTDFFNGLTGAGLSASMAAQYVEMSHGMNSGLIGRTRPVSAETVSPTSFEAFVPVLAGAFAAM